MNNIKDQSFLWGWFALELALEYWPAVIRGGDCAAYQECLRDTFWDALNGAHLS